MSQIYLKHDLNLLQAQAIAVAAANHAPEGKSEEGADPKSQDSVVSVVENSIVILMLVEDHLRLQSKLYCASSAVPETKSAPPVAPVTRSTEAARDHESTKVGELSDDVCMQLF